MGTSTSLGMRNRIINGAMVIDQRNAGASVTNINGTVYTVDRFSISGSVASKFTAQQNAGSVTPPVGFSYYLGMTSSSAYSVGSTDFFICRQAIEGFNTADLGWGTANAKTVTLSFQVYSSLTGTFGGCIQNPALTRNYPFTYTISSANTWTTISVTIAGDTSGTWVGATNAASLYVTFSLGAGSTYTGTAGTWSGTAYVQGTGSTSVVGTNSATFYITGVQLEKGSVATPFEYRQYGQELALSQRYYEQVLLSTGTYTQMVGLANSSTGGQFGFPFAVSKRTNPTVAIIGTVTLNTTGGASAGNMTLGGGGGSISGWAGGFSCSGSLGSAGNAAGIFGPNSGTNGFSVSAEL
jgi:hypothetical protein